MDEDGLQSKPPGFNLIHIPFADDLRSIPIGLDVAECKS